jgi:hypothetical protein
MRRRRLLALLGTAAAGGAAATGTGAFTSVEADRAVRVSVADDDAALLGLAPSPGPNGEYATADDGTLALSLSDTDAGGTGLGTDSTYEFDDVFRVRNRGTQPVYVWAELDYGAVPYDEDDLYLYPGSDAGDRLRDGDAAVLELDVGEAARIGVRVDTTDVAADVDVALAATIRADAERPAASGVADPGGDLTGAVVSETPTGDQFGSIGAAIDAVTESTVYVEPGTYDENLAIGSPDAGTDPASAPDAGVTVTAIGDGRPTLDGWVQILDPDVTFEGFEVTGEFEGFGVAAFEPGVTIRDVHVRGVTNGVFVPSVPDVRVENCRVESYSFYGALVSGRGAFGGSTPAVVGTTLDGASGGGAVGVGVVGTAAEIRGTEATGNRYEGNDGAGIAHFSGAGVTLRENALEDNDDGVFLAGPDAGALTATRNDLVGNRVGVANGGATAVDATANWWGSPEGPAAGTNGTGTEGPAVVEPWSTEPGPDWNADGTASVAVASASVSTASRDGVRSPPSPPSDPRPRRD